jgi:hypothetical protein
MKINLAELNEKERQEMMDEARYIIENSSIEELRQLKKVVFDKSNDQFGLKIPRDLALKSSLTSESEFKFIFNPNIFNIIDQIGNSKLVIILKNNEDFIDFMENK